MKHHCKNFIFLLLVQTSFLNSRNYTPQEFEKLNSDQQAIVLTDKNCQIIPEHNPDQNSPDKDLKIVVSHIEYAPIEGLNNNHNVFNNSSPHSNEFKTSHSLDSHYNNYAHNTHSNHSVSFSLTGGKAKEIPSPIVYKRTKNIMADASVLLQKHFYERTTMQIYSATITNHYSVLPGYTSPHGLYDHLDELSQFAHSDPSIIKQLKSRMNSYYGRIEDVLFNENGIFKSECTQQDQKILIYIYADFLKEFYRQNAASHFYDQTRNNPSALKYINRINWSLYDADNHAAKARIKAMRYAGSVNGNYGAALAALEAGDSEKAYTIGKQRVKTQYPGLVLRNLVPTTNVTSAFEQYPLFQQIAEKKYFSDKAQAEQKRAIKTTFLQKNAIKWCEVYKDENPYLPSNVSRQRQRAAQHSKNNPIFTQEHTLSTTQAKYIASEFLDKNKKFITLEGSYLQHQLIHESIQVIDTTLNRSFIEKMKNSVIDLTNASLTAIHRGDVLTSTYILDACWAFINFEKHAAEYVYSTLSTHIPLILEGIGEGVLESACEVGHAICHPIETIKGIGHSFVATGYFLGKAICAFVEFEAAGDLCESDFHAGQKALQKLAEKSPVPDLLEYAKTLTTKDIARGATKFIIDTYLLHKTTSLVSIIAKESLPIFARCAQKAIQSSKGLVTADGLLLCADDAEILISSLGKTRKASGGAKAVKTTAKITEKTSKLPIPSKNVSLLAGEAEGLASSAKSIETAAQTTEEMSKISVTAEGISTCTEEAKTLINNIETAQQVISGSTEGIETAAQTAEELSKISAATEGISTCAKEIKDVSLLAGEAEVLANEAELLTNNIKSTQTVISNAEAAEAAAQTTEELSKISVTTEEISACTETAETLINEVEKTRKVINGNPKIIEVLAKESVDFEVLIKAAKDGSKGKSTAVGRGFQKHVSRNKSFFGETTGDIIKNTEQGMNYVNEIINSPDTTFIIQNSTDFGNVLDIRLPDGLGARWSSTGEKFICFLEKRTVKK